MTSLRRGRSDSLEVGMDLLDAFRLFVHLVDDFIRKPEAIDEADDTSANCDDNAKPTEYDVEGFPLFAFCAHLLRDDVLALLVAAKS